MKLEQILNLADELVFAKTGKHLDNVQQTILEGAIQGKKYAQIATENQYSDSYIKESASELWQILSEAIGEEVKKANLKTTFERLYFYNGGSNLINNDLIHIGNVNFCTDTSQNQNKLNKLPSLPYIDRDNIPSIQSFYGRTEELQILEQWITEEKHKLVVIAGINGIGKTYLSLQFLEQIKDKFEFIIYRSLADFKNLKDLQSDLLESLSGFSGSGAEAQLQTDLQVESPSRFSENSAEAKLRTDLQVESLSGFSENSAEAQLRTDLKVALLEFLRCHSCLIILDDGESLFKIQRLAGEYQPQYQEYATFWEMVSRIQHKSCVILNTSEIPREVINLITDHHPIQLLNLSGIGENATEILKQQALKDDSDWPTLIELYQGNPLWLKLAATLIKDVFGGRVSQYLEAQLILPEDLKGLLNRLFQRLTETERSVIQWLSENDQPLSITQLLQKYSISPSELCNAVQSLQRRFLVETKENADTRFSVSSVIKEYCCVIVSVITDRVGCEA